jgi:hypothetical protein
LRSAALDPAPDLQQANPRLAPPSWENIRVDPPSVTGAKGLGEGGTIGAPAAVLNAVSDALAPYGVGIVEIPITPQRIVQLLRDAGCQAQRKKTSLIGRLSGRGSDPSAVSAGHHRSRSSCH